MNQDGYKLLPNGKRVMNRLNSGQISSLHNEYDRDPDWSKQKMIQIASRLNITVAKVYKWNWQQKKRFQGLS